MQTQKVLIFQLSDPPDRLLFSRPDGMQSLISVFAQQEGSLH